MNIITSLWIRPTIIICRQKKVKREILFFINIDKKLPVIKFQWRGSNPLIVSSRNNPYNKSDHVQLLYSAGSSIN